MKLLATICAALLPTLAFAFRWFLLKTDVRIGYVWKWEGLNFHPSFDIRNLSRSRTYILGNIAYTRNDGKEILVFDNKSLWGRELKPGTVTYLEAAPVPKIKALGQCPEVEIAIRLQNGTEFKAPGPGQLYKGIRRAAFSLRQRIERSSLPLAN